MVIHYLNVSRIPLIPHKSATDADRILPYAILFQFLNLIAWRLQVAQLFGRIEHLKLPLSRALNALEAPNGSIVEQILGISASERPDHPTILNRYALNVKQ
jgi:hypothetical protein